MKKLLLILTLVLAFAQTSAVYAQQKFTLSGVVLSKEGNKPIDMAVINLPQSELWAVADHQGRFTLRNIPQGATKVTISCLGYVTKQFDMTIRRDSVNVRFQLDEDNLAIEGVVVTARENLNSTATSRTIDRNTMDHMQMINVGDIASMLPGGSTVNPNLLNENSSKFNIRGNGLSQALGSFGTAVEVDGVRLSNNGDFGAMTGADTRNVASANVESIEVITGVPSVEYGDMTNGVVKINTKKGRTPYMVSATINPKTKQFSFDKGFDLGQSRGFLNTSLERARSVSQLASPYDSYDRNTLSLIYSNTFNQGEERKPLRFSVGLTGNIGGRNNEADPDAANDTYTKVRDNSLRGNVTLNWLLNQPWITSLEFSGSGGYADKKQTIRTYQSSPNAVAGRHGLEEGYFMSQDYDTNPNAPVVLTPAGYWYRMQYIDSKPIDYSAQVKANWVRRFGKVDNKLKLGVHFTGSGNNGRGEYYDDLKYAAEDWRPYEYRDEPFINNLAVYLSEDVVIPIGRTALNLVAGIRSDNTSIKGSAYGTVSSFSPRFNAKYTLLDGTNRRQKALRTLSLRASWGKAVKLPSFYTLYPQPTYTDNLLFASATNSAGTSYQAYYMQPRTINYNSDLRWQYTNLSEVGVDFNLYGVKVSLSAYYNKTHNPYDRQTDLTPYTYHLTTATDLAGCTIAEDNRVYSIDRQTGVVTVTDKTGAISPFTATGSDRKTFLQNYTPTNGSSYKQMGLEWIIDFGQIRSIRTDIRLDGAFTYYKSANQLLTASYYAGNDADGQPYKYIGYFIGGTGAANGTLNKQLKANVTFTTHIPKIRTIISLRVESSLYRFNQNLSEWHEGTRSYALSERNVQSDPIFGQSIYGQRSYVATYPAYYSTWDEPTKKIPFMEAFTDAKANDPALYAELLKLVSITTSDYYYQPQRISAYCAVNLSVTKEIGKIASISFYANNCFNNIGKVHMSNTDTDTGLFNSSYISRFYYGATLRLKF